MGFWAGCSKTAEIIPSSTANHTNRSERCTSTPVLEPARFDSGEENGPQFIPEKAFRNSSPKKVYSQYTLVLEIPRATNMFDLMVHSEMKNKRTVYIYT
jgi:hypothetical protein